MAFESALERDYFLTLEFDHTVKSYEEQPIKITGIVEGEKVHHTPDCLVNYHGDRRPLLVQVKYQEELDENGDDYRLRFLLAEKHARDNSMEFRVITDVEIRENRLRLDNFRLLYRFTSPPQNFGDCESQICSAVGDAGGHSIFDVLNGLSPERTGQAGFTPSIWHLLFVGRLKADLEKPLNYQTIMRINHGHIVS